MYLRYKQWDCASKEQFPGFLVCLVNTVVTFSIYKNAHPSNFKRPMGRGIDRESHMLEYISTHAHCAFFSHKKQWSDTGPSWPSCYLMYHEQQL
jgi:hypothetical protein